MLGEHDPRMERLRRFPHRQLLGWMYIGLGLIEAYISIRVMRMPSNGCDFCGLGFFFGFLFLLFSFVWFWGGEALLRNMRAARPLTIALSWILAVFGGGLVGLTLVAEFTFANAMPLPIVFGSALESLLLLALGIYGFVVARRILSPPHGGAQVNR